MKIIKRGPLSADEARGLAEEKKDELGEKEAEELIKRLQRLIKEEASKGLFTAKISVGKNSALVKGGFIHDVVSHYRKLGFKVDIFDSGLTFFQTIVVSWE
ncbi:hypothetical protein [Halalkalibacterium halodurans]|uniref:hypothetical protein n=1 Tax=Halalkalibacterium halodurans TaxID=86665 RepID=UPI002AAA3E98|nr:hypothetical protein [Halalkalibacterium halodurans]MDY7224684.1 hypothetical protein [Halalkalibacterium halodurans]MDY7243266.1 hypothetical protein [Halalkalibacterium halodurans]